MKWWNCVILTLGLIPSVGYAQLKTCTRTEQCAQGEVCVSYTNCRGQQVQRCISNDCYFYGIDCPANLICHERHCSDLDCLAK